MPACVTLFKWTDQGIKAVKETVARGQRFQQAGVLGGRHAADSPETPLTVRRRAH
jgi:uncharacterized protein with GYD domain